MQSLRSKNIGQEQMKKVTLREKLRRLEHHLPKFTDFGDYGWNTKTGQIEGLPKYIRDNTGKDFISNSQIDTFLTQVKTAVIDNVKSGKEKRQVRSGHKQVDRKGYPAYYNKQDKKG